MRWFIASMLALVLAWAVYLVSPYWALRDLASAVERGQPSAVSSRVNFRALRHSMAKQLLTEVAASERSGTRGTAGSPVAAAALAAVMDPILERYLTAESVAALLGAAEGSSKGQVQPPLAGGTVALGRAGEFLRMSSWRGFRNVYFTLPPQAPPETRFRLQMRLGGLTWRLVAVDLPPESRRAVVEAVLAGQRATRP